MKPFILRIDKDSDRDRVVHSALSAYEAGAERLIVIDETPYGDDAAKEEALLTIRAVRGSVDLPLTGTADIRRFEDVKKLLYAGCERVLFSGEDEERTGVFDEAQKRFGKARVGVFTPEDEGEEDLEALRAEYERNPKPRLNAEIAFSALKKGADGLVPVVVQDDLTNEVLMVAYMNEEAYEATLKSGRMTYYSRSRGRLWLKGEESGHFQYVRSLKADCDLDTILARVKQVGVACHTGAMSCFFNKITEKETDDPRTQDVLKRVYDTVIDRKEHPKEGSYTNYLFDKGVDKILKKLGEESTEIVIAAKNPDDTEIIYEISDYLYHMMVLMADKGVTWDDINEELARRHT